MKKEYVAMSKLTRPISPLTVMDDLLPALPKALQQVAEYGIADLIGERSMTLIELADATGTQPDMLYAVLKTVSAAEYFVEDPPGTFSNTPLSRFLSPQVPGSQYNMARMLGAESQWRIWEQLDYGVKTGQEVFSDLYGKKEWQYFQDHPDTGIFFMKAMTEFSTAVNRPIASAYPDFAHLGTLIDLGGGQGTLLATLLTTYPSLRGILFDVPAVIEQAEQAPIWQSFGSRSQLVAGNFFDADSIPPADAVILKQIVQDWTDEENIELLRNVRAALPPHGRVLVTEIVLTPSSPPFAFKLSLLLRLALGGKVRTEEEFRRLFERAGFRVTNIFPTLSLFSLIEGVPSDALSA
jgi:hypothetical protein